MKKYGEYIEKLKKVRIFPERKEGQSREDYARERMLLGLKYGVYALAALAVLRGVIVTLKANVSASNNVNGRELPIYCVETDEAKIALTFDAAWGNEDTQKILEILKKNDVRATFFMTGGWVESYPDDVKAILADGHDLGNHSENHKNMSQLSDAEKKEELMQVHQKVQELTGYEMFLFRPPYGDYDNAVVNVAKDCGYYTIQWDVDSLDWKDYGVDSIIKTVTEHKHLGNGSIILCHNGAKYTAQALDTMITTLKQKGYTFVPLSELIYKDKYHMNHEGRQIPAG
jgi:polysaccharide deacetylase family sporulation protein PdaB